MLHLVAIREDPPPDRETLPLQPGWSKIFFRRAGAQITKRDMRRIAILCLYVRQMIRRVGMERMKIVPANVHLHDFTITSIREDGDTSEREADRTNAQNRLAHHVNVVIDQAMKHRQVIVRSRLSALVGQFLIGQRITEEFELGG